MRRRNGLFAGLIATAAVLALAGSASATFHDMRIRAVFKGPADASFIELQMLSDGQNQLDGKTVDLYDQAGAALGGGSTLLANSGINGPIIGQSQRTVLIGDSATAGNPDFVNGNLYGILDANPGGAVCFEDVDCVAWGNFAGPLPSPDADPLDTLSASMVSHRTLGRGCATALDAADDSNNSAADFLFGFFPPRNNTVAPTETLCPPPPVAGPTGQRAAALKKCAKIKKNKKKKKKCKKRARKLPV